MSVKKVCLIGLVLGSFVATTAIAITVPSPAKPASSTNSGTSTSQQSKTPASK